MFHCSARGRLFCFNFLTVNQGDDWLAAFIDRNLIFRRGTG
jgi:hypothetical protein